MIPENPTNTPALRPAIMPGNDAVMTALRGAADETGADFGYLLRTAMRESSLNPQASASTSSATGLFQFIEQTWLGTLRTHGAEHGLKAYADAIQVGKDGRFVVRDSAQRQEILALRKDPHVAALMAGELTNDSRATLETALGRGVSAGELYVAHFLGPQAAVRMVRAASETPSTDAASLFPEAAAANRSIFYAKNGDARSVAAVLSQLTSRHDGAMPGGMMLAATVPAEPAPALPPALRGSQPEAPAQMPHSAGDTFARFGLEATIITPLVAQMLASLPAPQFAAAFSPDDDTDPASLLRT